MKRQIILLGRLGTVVVAIGIALLMVSLIPTYAGSTFSSTEPISPGRFQPLGAALGNPFSNSTIYFEYFTTLTPQQELKVQLSCNDTVDAYLLKINSNTLLQTLNSNSGDSRNATLLEDYLNAHPSIIAWQGKITQGAVDYTPTEIINATLIFSNPSQKTIFVQYDGKVLNLLAPANKTRTLSYEAIPVGLILTIPWLNVSLKQRKKSD